MTASALPLLLLGFSLGMRHATDADHVLAVATIVSRVRNLGVALSIGALWGIGHTATLLVVGGAILLFGWVVPPHVGLAMELGVALMLIALGVMHFRRAARASQPSEENEAKAAGHDHDHHDLGGADRWLKGSRLYLSVRPFLIGVVHGLAGSAAVALLVLATVRDPRWGIGYMLLFGMGTVAGMMLITAALALPFTYTRSLSARIHRGLGMATGLLSLGFGLVLAYDIGIGSGLFTSSPQWAPG